MLVGQLLEAGMVRTPRVEAAMRAVPRHVFLPGVPLQRAYANDVVQTKRNAEGVPISAASQPSIVGAMLEQLDIRPGMRILEIGAGTGYNAALLAYLTGDGGEVVTVDVDDDITARARAALAAAGAANVTVLRGDGALGAPGLAPFDRIIATVGVWDLPLAWQEQLTPGGRIVAPLRLRGSVTRSIAFQRPDRAAPGAPAELHSVSSEMCGFMPLRASIASDPRRIIPLHPSGDVTLEVQQEQNADPELLAGVLDTERVTVWTGVGFTDVASAEWLYLWLTCTLPGGLFGIAVRPTAADQGIVAPMFRWGAMAAVAGDSLAYLTFGPAAADGTITADGQAEDAAAGGAGPREVGVIGHGSRGRELAEAVAEQVRSWNRDYRTRTADFTIRPLTTVTAGEHKPGEFTIRTPNNVITVSWRGT
jgi:protein-L-isoaspartate(D-aspartate) O-methyltransferase